MSTRKTVRKAAKKPARKPALKRRHVLEDAPVPPKPVLGDMHWNELQTTHVEAAKGFYTNLFGWTTTPFGGGMDYTILLNGGKGFGGIMKAPHAGRPPVWVNYVVVQDIDAIVAKVERLGGKACAPFDVPGVGRLSIVEDPQGALFGVHEPRM